MTGRAIPVGSLAAFELVRRPAAVFRVNLYPAIRIRGGPPKGTSAAESATKCMKLAEDELKRGEAKGFTVEDLTSK
jgi:multidrug efflux pump subunit AcrB